MRDPHFLGQLQKTVVLKQMTTCHILKMENVLLDNALVSNASALIRGANSIFTLLAVHGFSNDAMYNVVEGEVLNTTFGINVKGNTHFYQLPLPGTITSIPNTAGMWTECGLSYPHAHLL